MGFDKMKDKFTRAASKNADKLDDGIDNAAEFVDEKTGGKHSDKIDSATDKAKGLLGKDEGEDGNESEGEDQPRR